MRQLLRFAVRLLLCGLLIAPDVIAATRHDVERDPCGMKVCCCPGQCRKLRAQKRGCAMNSRSQCGLRLPSATTAVRNADSWLVEAFGASRTRFSPPTESQRMTEKNDTTRSLVEFSPPERPPIVLTA